MNKTDFASKMDQLRARYGTKKQSDSAWRDILKAYYGPLSKHEDSLVIIAIEKAWDHHRVWFPTLGELLTIIDAEKRHFASRQEDAGSEKPWADERAGAHIKKILKDLEDKMTMEPGK